MQIFRFRLSDITLRILIGYLGVVITLVLIMVVADTNMAKTQIALENSTHKYVPQMNIASSIRTIVQEQMTLVRDFTAGNKDVKQRYRELERMFRDRITEYEMLGPDEQGLINLQMVKREHSNFNLVANHIFKYEEAGREKLVDELWKNYKLTGKKMMDTANQLLEQSNSRVHDAQIYSEDIIERSRKIMYSIAFVSISACFILTYLTSKNILDPLSGIVSVSRDISAGDLTKRIKYDTIGEFSELARSFNTMVDNLQSLIQSVITSSREIAGASDAFRAHTQQSAAAYNMINNSFKDMALGARNQAERIAELQTSAGLAIKSIDNITQSIHMIDRSVESTSQTARNSGDSVRAAVDQMKAIEHKVGHFSEDVRSLIKDVQKISEIIENISRFAKKTNLLALNAAIEAARAGEQGRGFAVVSEEIRSLAFGSGQLVEKIRDIIDNIRVKSQNTIQSMEEGKTAVSTGTVVINESGESLSEIFKAINTVSGQTREVASNTSTITETSQKMMHAISENERISQDTVTVANEMSSLVNSQARDVQELLEAAGKLAEMAMSLQQAVSGFRVR